MQKISPNEIIPCVENALKEGKRNILFVSCALCHYEQIPDWAAENPQYRLIRHTPQPVWEEKNGLLFKNEARFAIGHNVLTQANSENAIWFLHGFSQESLYDFEGFLNILKGRFYNEGLADGGFRRCDLEKLPLFAAFTAPYEEGDWSALDPKYYDLFDAVYTLD